jgi:hypothetical protein
MEANAASIIRAFLRHNVPITAGIITGPTPNYDCYASWLKPLHDSTTLIELSSHSVSHIELPPLAYEQQLYEIEFSKNKIETLFNTIIHLFFPPFNHWNADTVRAVVAAGYTTFSPQCTFVQTAGSTPGDMCTTNMYPDVRPAFFPPIDGLIHIPVGSAITRMDASGGALPPATVVNAASERCVGEGICSIASQIEGMTHVTDPNVGTFAVVMMHPNDFPDGADAAIQSYFDDLLSQVKPIYDIRTISNLPK